MARTTKKTKAGARKAAARRKTGARQASKKVVRLRSVANSAKRKAARKAKANGVRKVSNGLPKQASGLPKPSALPWGAAGKALDGVRILDFTHVQSGPTCTQLLGYMGADVIKIERPGVGDITRGQLRDVPNADSLYFTMLNGNKRSITVDMKTSEGKQVFVDLLKKCDIMMENFGPGVLERFGFTWDKMHEINPKIVVGSIKGFGSSGP